MAEYVVAFSPTPTALYGIVLLIAIVVAYLNSWLSCFCFVLVAIIWFVPDQRIERVLRSRSS
ncbi:hypothetical protein [Paenibacillus nasutitermitis]|uniref:hypothetical protein n=1 Tax=Paenibacillus nasutitermitis TaxID=1652958 RepID=UPI001E62C12C|nr:hypothetical protein [Paenibacillus nasutitermitis]